MPDPSAAGRPDETGFTLFEVLVVLAILALLAAVVLPIIADQLEEGDPVRLSSDLTDLRTGIELFQLDVRPRSLPGDLEDLSQPIDSLDADITDRIYSRSEQRRWDGPYVDFLFPFMGVALPDTTHLSTGFDGRLFTDLIRYDESEDPGIHTAIGADGDTIPVDAPDETLEEGRDWAAIVVVGLDEIDFERANDQIDGPAENDGNFDGESQWEGRFRFDDELQLTFFLVAPLKDLSFLRGETPR